jgi:Domain of unknown function (DUF4136)
MRRILFAVVFALVACAAPRYDIDFDYDTGTDYASLKTYDWMPPTGNATKDELLVKRVRSSVDAGLKKKGCTQSSTNPDFLIAMQLSGRSAYGGSTAVGVSVGIPVGRAGRVSVGGAKSKPIETKEGQIVLDFLDPKSKGLLWRATAAGSARPAISPEEQQERIDQIVGEMLDRFPPRK